MRGIFFVLLAVAAAGMVWYGCPKALAAAPDHTVIVATSLPPPVCIWAIGLGVGLLGLIGAYLATRPHRKPRARPFVAMEKGGSVGVQMVGYEAPFWTRGKGWSLVALATFLAAMGVAGYLVLYPSAARGAPHPTMAPPAASHQGHDDAKKRFDLAEPPPSTATKDEAFPPPPSIAMVLGILGLVASAIGGALLLQRAVHKRPRPPPTQ